MNKTEMIKTVVTYFECFNSANPEGIAALFAENATVQDPYGAPSKVGKDAIMAYYKGAAKKGTQLVQKSPTVVSENRAAFAMTVVVEGMNKEKNVTDVDLPSGNMEIDVIDMFEFNDEGKIVTMTAYWDPELNIRKIVIFISIWVSLIKVITELNVKEFKCLIYIKKLFKTTTKITIINIYKKRTK